jgi:hypothetical protein
VEYADEPVVTVFWRSTNPPAGFNPMMMLRRVLLPVFLNLIVRVAVLV